MKFIDIFTLILVIVGGLNWGLVGLFSFDLVAAIFGVGSGLAPDRLHPGRTIGGLADHSPVFCNGLRQGRCWPVTIGPSDGLACLAGVSLHLMSMDMHSLLVLINFEVASFAVAATA